MIALHKWQKKMHIIPPMFAPHPRDNSAAAHQPGEDEHGSVCVALKTAQEKHVGAETISLACSHQYQHYLVLVLWIMLSISA